MKLYKKQLSSIEELKLEKQKLKKKLKDTDVFSMPENSKEDAGLSGANLVGTVADLISSPSIAGTVGSIAMPLVSLAGKKIQKKYFLRIAKEFIGGYAKWKAIELAYKAARSYIKSRKRKKAERKALEA